MKEVVNVSLQGVSFVIEKDALDLLESYLDELRNHYGEGEVEVVDDIEERIAELLIERGCKDSVVQYHHVREVIDILGRPSQIDGEEEREEKVSKRIYRDTENGIVAGVCSGLGAYFNMDAVWMRVLFLAVSFLITTPIFSIARSVLRIDLGWVGFMLAAYCILWIIIPAAKTVSQRCQMRGEAQNVDQIHRKFAQGARNVGSEMWQTGTKVTGSFLSTLWRIICFSVGVILTVMGFGGILALGVLLVGFDAAMGISLLQIPDFMALDIGSTLWLKAFGILTFLLPCVGMLYGGMQLCFRFKSPAWRPGLVLFLLWMVSASIFIVCSVKACSPYYNMGDGYKEKLSFGGEKDTIYVECPMAPGMQQAKLNMEASRWGLRMFYLNNSMRKQTSFAAYPRLLIRRSQDVTVPYVETEIISPYRGTPWAGEAVTLKDSLVTLVPDVYSKEHKFAGKIPVVRLYIPDSTTVILKEPINHTFGKRSYRCGIFN